MSFGTEDIPSFLKYGITAGKYAGIPGFDYLGGPFNLVTSALNGNPIGAASGAASSANSLSGALGGPTLTSLLESLGVETMGAGTGAVAGGMALPLIMMASGLWSNSHNLPAMQKAAQKYERNSYQSEWPSLTSNREWGASTFGDLPSITSDPNMSKAALGAALRGIRADDLSSGFANLSGNQGGKPIDLSAWAQKAPQLEGQNWGAWARLMDATGDTGREMAAASVNKPHQQVSVHRHGYGPNGNTGMMIGGQLNPVTDYGSSVIDLGGGQLPLESTSLLDPTQKLVDKYRPGAGNGFTTQEAQDISNAIAGVGQQLGVKWGDIPEQGPNGWQNQGYTFMPEQLKDYGFTEGHYAPAILSYLRTIAPQVEQSPNWNTYMSKMGVTPDQLTTTPGRLTGNPFAQRDAVSESDYLKAVFGQNSDSPYYTGGA